jgi:hypothetical protein
MRGRPVSSVYRELRGWMFAGFAVMFLTGGLLFTAHATSAYESGAFRLKVALIALAGVNALVYHWTIGRSRGAWDNAAVPPLAARVAGLFSLALWFAVIAAGRIFAYSV